MSRSLSAALFLEASRYRARASRRAGLSQRERLFTRKSCPNTHTKGIKVAAINSHGCHIPIEEADYVMETNDPGCFARSWNCGYDQFDESDGRGKLQFRNILERRSADSSKELPNLSSSW